MGFLSDVGKSLFGGGDSSSSSNSTQYGYDQSWSNSAPWQQQSPFLGQGYATAQNLFSQGGPQYYQGNTVAPFSPITNAAIGATVDRATQGNPLVGQGQNYLSNTLSGQYTPDPSKGFAGLNAMASGNSAYMLNPGSYSATAPGNMLDTVDYSKIGDVSVGNEHLNRVQNGEFLGSNPYLDKAVGGATSRLTQDWNNSVLPGLNATFGAGGRTGSGIHSQTLTNAADKLGENIGDMTSSMYSNAYNFERGNQDQAATNLMDADLAAKLGNQGARAGAENTNASLSATGLGAATDANIASMQAQLQGGLGNQGAWGAGNNLAYNAANSITGNYFSGLNNMNNAVSSIPSMQNADYFDINQLMGVGGMVDSKAQDFTDADVNRWNYNAEQPYNMLDWYMSAIGAPVMSSNSYSQGYRYGDSSSTGKSDNQTGLLPAIFGQDGI